MSGIVKACLQVGGSQDRSACSALRGSGLGGAASMPRRVELCLSAGPDALLVALTVCYPVLWETAEIKLRSRWLIPG